VVGCFRGAAGAVDGRGREHSTHSLSRGAGEGGEEREEGGAAPAFTTQLIMLPALARAAAPALRRRAAAAARAARGATAGAGAGAPPPTPAEADLEAKLKAALPGATEVVVRDTSVRARAEREGGMRRGRGPAAPALAPTAPRLSSPYH